MPLIQPIYDRTQLDIYNQTAKGFMNVADWNRIENNLQFLAETFGVSIPNKAWTVQDFPATAQMVRLLGNLDAVKAAYYVLPEWPATPQLPVNHFEKVNDIEYLTLVLWQLWADNTDATLYCGEFAAGEELGVI